MRTLSRGVEAVKKGTPQNVRLKTPFLTSERVQSVKMNFFIEKTRNNTSGDGHYYKMGWMREARIRTFMQLELVACLEEITWMIRCHNCEALNCPQEEYRRGLCLSLQTALTICRVD